MNIRKIIGIVLLVIGIVAFGASIYIKDQVKKGQEQVNSAQGTVDQGNRLFSMNPVTKEVGGAVTGSVQKKINAGKDDIVRYTEIAHWLEIGGIVFFVVGCGILIIRSKKHSN